MEYTALIEIAPIALIWMAPILVLGLAIFLMLVLFAWLHDTRSASEQ